jgi:hypothetical protein
MPPELEKVFMRSFAFRLVALLVSLTLGFVAHSLRVIVSPRPDFVGNWPIEASKRVYKRGPAGEATTGSFITLYSSDGMSFTKWTVECRTPEGARKEMQKRLSKAVRIVSREPLFDQNGEQIGETVVALVPPNGADYAAATLIWTEKDELCQVEGSTLGNILEYRKDFNH